MPSSRAPWRSGASLVFCLLAPLAAPWAAAAPSWSAVGGAVPRAGLRAASLAFDDGSSSADDGVPPFAAGTPLLAVGADGAAPGDTTVDFLRWADGGNWSVWARHTPQFAQDYASFRFRFSGGRAHLGLAIPSDGALASVLRSGAAGSDGQFEGCWAFAAAAAGAAFDFAIGAGGDMRLVTVGGDDAAAASAPAQPVLLTYGAAGWDSYPATDTFGPATALPQPPGAASVAQVAVAADAGGRDVLVAALSSAPPAASILVLATTLSNGSAVAAVASPLAGSDAALAVGGGAICVALFAAAGDLRVSCAAEGAAPGSAWADAGSTGDAGDGSVPPAVALTPSRLLVAAAAAAGSRASTVAVALCQLPAGDALGACVGGWQQAPLPVVGAAAVRGIELKAAASGEVFALVRTDADVQVFALEGV